MKDSKKLSRVVVVAAIAVALMFLIPTGVSSAQPMNPNNGSNYSTTIVPPSSIPPNTTLTVTPPVKIPTGITPLTYVLGHNYTTPKEPRVVYMNVNIPSTPWEAIILNYTGSVFGTVYDTEATLSVDNVTVFRSVNPENGYYDIVTNLTQYEPLFHGQTSLAFAFPDAAVDGEYISNVSVSLYSGSAPAGLPDNIVSLTPAISGLFIGNSDNYTLPVSVPNDTQAAVMQVWLVGNSFDESWYADEPSYRSLEISAGNHLIANVLPYYKVASGELDLFAWRPLMAPYEINMIPYTINVTAALGLLEHSQNLTLKIPNVSPLGAFWKVRITMLLWTSSDVKGASLVSYGNSTTTSLHTDVYMPNAGTSANGGNVSTPQYFFEEVNLSYHFTSIIYTTTGSIIASKETRESSYMNQYSINLVWENWTAYQLTTSTMITRYNERGNHAINIDKKVSYYPFTADTGFSFSVTTTTNGGFPMYGPFASYLNGTYIAWNVTNYYTSISNHMVIHSRTFTSNSVSVQNGVFAGVIELTSPVAGIIVNITKITSITSKDYLSTASNFNGKYAVTTGYQHTITAVSNNPSGPFYFGNVTFDEYSYFQYTGHQQFPFNFNYFQAMVNSKTKGGHEIK